MTESTCQNQCSAITYVAATQTKLLQAKNWHLQTGKDSPPTSLCDIRIKAEIDSFKFLVAVQTT
jgi:hypothetical protein